jgi:DNA polymerase lambda
MSPKRKQPPSPIGDLFAGIGFEIVPLGSLKGKVRQEIIRNRIIENGAHEDDSGGIALADLGVGLDIIRRHLKSPTSQIVDVSWVTDCLSTNYKLEFDDYLPEQSVSRPDVSDTKPAELPNTGGMNESIASMFEELESLISGSPDKRDQFRAMAYRRAAAAVRNYRQGIFSISDAEELRPQIGQRSFEKVIEFMQTGSVKKADYLRSDPTVIARNQLMGVWGIGPSKADDLITLGITSVEQLKTMPDSEVSRILNHNQRLGLMYYDDLLPKMPRAEVEEIVGIIKGSIFQLFDGTSHGLKCIVCGSYRRGAELCSDADLLLYWDNEVRKSAEDTLRLIVSDLIDKGYMLAHFNKDNHGSIFLGIFRAHPERPARRVDLKVWEKKALPFALLHFTGNADFNRKIRLYAKRHGFKLTDTSLTKGDQSIPCETEHGVFQALSLQYIEPQDRTSSVDLISLSTGKPITENLL